MSTPTSASRNVEIYRAERAALDAHLNAIFADWQTKRAFAVASFEAKWADFDWLIEMEEANRFAAKHEQQELRAWQDTEAVMAAA